MSENFFAAENLTYGGDKLQDWFDDLIITVRCFDIGRSLLTVDCIIAMR